MTGPVTAPLTDAQVAALREAYADMEAHTEPMSWEAVCQQMTDIGAVSELTDWMRAASPDVVLALLAERDALKVERDNLRRQLGPGFAREWLDMMAAKARQGELDAIALSDMRVHLKQAEAALSALRARETGLREWVKRMQEPGASTYRVPPPEGFIDGYREAMSDVQDAMQEAATPAVHGASEVPVCRRCFVATPNSDGHGPLCIDCAVAMADIPEEHR